MSYRRSSLLEVSWLPANLYPIKNIPMSTLRDACSFQSAQALAMYGAAMRTTDDPTPRPFNPLWQKVTPAAPKHAEPKQVAPGVLQGADGRLYTDIPLPKVFP